MKRTTSTFATSLLAATAALIAVGSAPAADFPAGTYAEPGFTLAFDSNGHFRGSQKDAVKVEGDYAVSGNQVTFTDTSGPWACPAKQTGTYRWESNGDTLTFSKVSDACKDRVNSLTPHSWKKQG
ncbi:MAG TPA: hypothetical protein VJ727_05105 [Rhodanobacteraceae bacterium]|nr:hypothetical protein [Rhodanobacteraceae bacterium]